ncbi:MULTISPECIES: tRNA pseudouridine(55) synthase TruB [unclassified Gordonia (in: high G+C Gram-positive bacteria)]|uniref:tRNA pseudouridine(55) synthase TruB n=1 Tax=Gordonia TaxID=2053 RepID=UPI000990AB7D|nr:MULTISPECIES: tRNA pseudouridine(55) synthase TruB [unclassified Gordonia (in: high G+C Gram-positive bacteria)]MBR7192177.1 tRNA pseudouridine(55) synthase TruB [Gordonia sp. SCSIO 19800]MCX2752408.1 tRNA pseudouridine(55) synthase TruB [Gordonia sp. 4N]
MADATIENAGLLVVDKPAGMTSHDVVSRCRKIFNTRRVGHAGTLDPMATGVLVVGIERATKLLGLLSLTTKSYTATIRLGASTTTDDREGEILDTADASGVLDADIATAMADLTGDIQQVPAKVSAIKVDGRRAHALVRTGADFDLAPRPVTVSCFELLDARRDAACVDLDVAVDCSSGTYIRSLARDLGAALGVGGHLTELRRTAVGPFTLDHARTLDDVRDEPRVSLDIDEAVKISFPRRDIDDDEAESISQGRWLEPIGRKEIYVVVDPREQAIALIQEKGRRASSVMVVRPATLR